jgi:hypothetical protein
MRSAGSWEASIGNAEASTSDVFCTERRRALFRHLDNPWGQNWYDFGIILLTGLAVLAIVVYAFRRYRIYCPPWQPLVLLCLAFWLVGLFFGGVHALIWYYDRSAFTGLKEPTNWDFTYFSFVTITTLGYGDIHPASVLARWFSVVEACCGLFFVAVLLALLLNGAPRAGAPASRTIDFP